MKDSPYIAVSCGGTGGHTYPGLATAKILQEVGADVVVLQAGRRAVEQKTLSQWQGKVLSVGISSGNKFTYVTSIVRTFFAFLRRRPQAVLIMGSYTGIPAAVAAKLLRIPVVLHEANAIPGRGNAFYARMAREIAVAFPDADFEGKRVRDVGMPLRGEFVGGSGTSEAVPGRFRLLVMGGSQGAEAVNRVVAEAVLLLHKREPEFARCFDVVHLSGVRHESVVRGLYGSAPNVTVKGYSNDMSRLYREADFCISRAGASSIFELALVGLPALFVPLPGLANDHQRFNAESVVRRGGGEMVLQGDLSAEWLCDYLLKVARDVERRRRLREGLLALSRPDAARNLASVVMEVAGK